MKKYVLTGGPGSGKTSILSALEKEGFRTISDIARVIMKEEEEKNGTLLPWINFDNFQREILRRSLERLDNLEEGVDVFFDYAIPDCLAFYMMEDVEPCKEVFEAASKYRYDKVFLLEMLPDYKMDSERWTTLEQAKKAHKHIGEVYRGLGYDLVHVPDMAIEDRDLAIKARVKIIRGFVAQP